MFDTLPDNIQAFLQPGWPGIRPFFDDLAARPLTPHTLDDWMRDWGRLGKLVDEGYWWLWVQTTLDTTDPEIERRFQIFLEQIREPAEAAEQILRRKLLESGLQPRNFAQPLRNMRAEADLFRQANLPLLTQEQKLSSEYDRIKSLQTVTWEGEERTVVQMWAVNYEPGRARREAAWRLVADRQLADRQALNDLWVQFMDLRGQLAHNAALPDYRAYRWQQLLRLDYTPQDCARFHDSIEEVVVPAVQRLLERRRQRMGIESVRPWDVDADPFDRPALQPFTQAAEMEDKAEHIFRRVDPQLGDYFAVMRREGLLDLDNRKGKMPSAYCASFNARQRPFIFMNAVGTHDDVMTILHEAGHAFHTFENAALPYHQQLVIGTEFHEVASMSMEYLAAPCLESFYRAEEVARARVEHLETALRFWPYMAVVDAFQHWAYTHHQAASDPANCDAQWAQLWARFMKGEDWSGLDDVMMTGWQRKLHIFQVPFYYIDYGLAALGAVQVWAGALSDQRAALARYRGALALGGTVSLPELYSAAGARLAFDAGALREAVELMESTIEQLQP